MKLNNDDVPLLYHKPDIIFITFIETGDETEFEKIVRANEQGTSIIINKKDFHKKQVEKVKVKFIEPDKLSTNDFSDETIAFLKKVGDFDGFITDFVNLTKGKIYGK